MVPAANDHEAHIALGRLQQQCADNVPSHESLDGEEKRLLVAG
jgi:hypothetical protein